MNRIAISVIVVVGALLVLAPVASARECPRPDLEVQVDEAQVAVVGTIAAVPDAHLRDVALPGHSYVGIEVEQVVAGSAPGAEVGERLLLHTPFTESTLVGEKPGTRLGLLVQEHGGVLVADDCNVVPAGGRLARAGGDPGAGEAPGLVERLLALLGRLLGW